jgi:predicted nucleic acid-binding protein
LLPSAFCQSVIAAIDTNVLFDLLIPGTPFGEVLQRALEGDLQAGRLVISDMLYAELAVHFSSQRELDRFLADTGLRSFPLRRQRWCERATHGHSLAASETIPCAVRSAGTSNR